METIPFEKYQGTGNDFIMIDHRDNHYKDLLNPDLISIMCNRHMGIGGDGLILLEKSEKADFKMVYFNADGRQSTMCGNGGRCIIAFAWNKGIIERLTTFEAIDGPHQGIIDEFGIVSLQMSDVSTLTELNDSTIIINTGSPHYVSFCDLIPDDVRASGAAIRYSETFSKEGINVNFVVKKTDGLIVATYERGVENETLSCGTGVTAAALAHAYKNKSFGKSSQKIATKGGMLSVDYNFNMDGKFTDIWLKGPAINVFKGEFIFRNPEKQIEQKGSRFAPIVIPPTPI